MGVCFTSLDTDKEESDMLVGWSRLGDHRLPRDVFVEKKIVLTRHLRHVILARGYRAGIISQTRRSVVDFGYGAGEARMS